MHIEVGNAYVFAWFGREVTGVVVRMSSSAVCLRTKTTAFSVPIECVLRPAA